MYCKDITSIIIEIYVVLYSLSHITSSYILRNYQISYAPNLTHL